jgi:enterochelin esterase-like enzyme
MNFYKLSLILFILIFSFSIARAGTVYSVEFFSPSLVRNWTYTVYLPEGYDNSELKYPVVYLLHGNGGNHNDWVINGKIEITLDRMISSGEIPPVITVTADVGTGWYVDRKEKFESAFIKDLIPEIDSRFRTVADRSGRFLAGFSMGGYGTLRFALIYPELFCAAGLINPALYDPEPPESSSARKVGIFGDPYDGDIWKSLNYPVYLETFIKKNTKLPIYIICGDDDYFNIELHSTLLYEKLRKAGQPAELRIYNGGHTWEFASERIGEVLKYMLFLPSHEAK